MYRVLAILIFFLGVALFEKGDIIPLTSGTESEFIDLHHAQLECNHRHNIDIERTSSVVVPAVRTTSSNISRQAQQRLMHLVACEHSQTTTNYSVSRFIHRLGSYSRAVDFYLYVLCQLRL
ncbi:MAG: hypothetical protein E7140_04955 [Rikenellaceae bacterium]|nr:hypothetical protein [Rikenellaceae bacterium]